MRSGSHVVVRRVGEHMVVIDPTREAIDVRRSGSAPTPDDTQLDSYAFIAVSRVELFVARDGSHRMVLAVGSREGIDLGSESTRAQGLDVGKSLSRLFNVMLDIRDGDYLESYVREQGPILSRLHDGKHLIDAVLVDPIDPKDELASPWEDQRAEVSYDDLERDFSMDDLLIEIQATIGAGGGKRSAQRAKRAGSEARALPEEDPEYDDGPFAEPRVRTAPEVEAVFPLPNPIDPPPMSEEAEAQVRASHRPPRQPGFERRDRLAWLRAALKALTA